MKIKKIRFESIEDLQKNFYEIWKKKKRGTKLDFEFADENVEKAFHVLLSRFIFIDLMNEKD